MSWVATAEELWPKWDSDLWAAPVYPEGGTPWVLIDPNSKGNLRSQIAALDQRCDFASTKLTLEGGVWIDPSAKIASSAIIEGPCYIGPNAEVRANAYVRAWSWLCRESVLGHACEIKHSILLPGAKAPHFNYVGDSIIGPNSNLGAGVILSNLRHDNNEVRVRIGTKMVDTGLRKFGSLVGADVSIGCNAVLNPGVILGPGCSVWPVALVSGTRGPNEICN